jgi:uncharacterized membrane protein YgdD (TMEM256/DUF423 family)
MNRTYFRIGCYLAALAVVLGAFGAHALKGHLTVERLATFETAVRYQMYAALGLQLAALVPDPAPKLQLAMRLLLAGMAIFSVSLYLLCLTGFTWLGAITPLGGVALILGWGLAGYAGGERV